MLSSSLQTIANANDAPVRTMSHVLGEGMDCLAVNIKDVVRAPAASPTTHVVVPPDVTLQAPFVSPAPDVSVAVTVDHGLHDAVSVIVTGSRNCVRDYGLLFRLAAAQRCLVACWLCGLRFSRK